MKRLFALILLITLMLCGCAKPEEPERLSRIFYDGTDCFGLSWMGCTYEEDEIAMRGVSLLSRSKAFGDRKLQEAAKNAALGLELTSATDLLEYAVRLTPAVLESGYFEDEYNKAEDVAGWKLDFANLYSDGVAVFHFDEKPAPEYENGYKLQYRPAKYDGGAYAVVSLLDGHIISLQDGWNRAISAKETDTRVKEKAFAMPTMPFDLDIDFTDVTLEEHFYSTYQSLHKDDTLFHAAPKSSKEKLKDNQLQKNAKELAHGLNLKTPEGMAEYALKLGELLIDSDYNMCSQGFELSSIERYTDGVWAIDYSNAVTRIDGKETTKWSTAYISEEDGHIICMTDLANGLVLGESDIRYKAPQVKIDEEQSFFSDFKVDNGKVTIKCHIVLINSAHYPIEVSLLADFTEDVVGGLLQEDEILGASASNHNIKTFLVSPGSKAFEIDFCGTFAGTMQKQDRLLPEIEIIEH